MNSWNLFLSLTWALFWAGVLATLGAGALWALAFQGRISDWRPSCSRCRFRLHAVPPVLMKCPECGADLLRPRSIAPSARTRSAGTFFAAFLLSAVAALAFIANKPTTLPRLKEWWRSQQSVETLITVAATDPEDAWREWTRRLNDQRLSEGEIDEVLSFATTAALKPPNTIANYDDARPFLRSMTLQSRWTSARRHALLEFLLAHDSVTITSAGTFMPGKSIALNIQSSSPLDPARASPGSLNASWPGLRISIASIRIGLKGEALQTVKQFTAGDSTPSGFATLVLFAPTAPGVYEAQIDVRVVEAGDAKRDEPFARTLVLPWSFRIRDPAATLISFESDPDLAGRVQQWLAGSRIEIDEVRQSGEVHLPAYQANLLPADLSLGYRVKVSQGEHAAEAGQFWMSAPFSSGYKGQLSNFTIPKQWDTSLPASITFEPDPELAIRRGEREGRALLDMIEIKDVKLRSAASSERGGP